MNIIKKVFNKITYIKTDRYVKFKQRELQKVLLREPLAKKLQFADSFPLYKTFLPYFYFFIILHI
jgi:hypothetical protein